MGAERQTYMQTHTHTFRETISGNLRPAVGAHLKKVEINDFSIRTFQYKVTVILENINLLYDLQYIWVLCCCLEYP